MSLGAGDTSSTGDLERPQETILHPNDAGYVVMAGVWYAKIGPLLR